MSTPIRKVCTRSTGVLVPLVVVAWLTIPALPALAANAPPELAAIGNQMVAEQTQLRFDAQATDQDVGDVLTFSLGATAPAGAAINPSTGVFTWTPTEAQGGFDPYTFDVVVRDNADSPEEDSEAITVTVAEVNVAPVLEPITSQVLAVGATLSFTLHASDADFPENTLVFSLTNAPANVEFDTTTGAFSWSPTESQAGTWTFQACVSDGALKGCRQIVIEVRDGNRPPVIDSVGIPSTTSIAWGQALAFQVSAHDPDEVTGGLHFSLVGARRVRR